MSFRVQIKCMYEEIIRWKMSFPKKLRGITTEQQVFPSNKLLGDHMHSMNPIVKV